MTLGQVLILFFGIIVLAYGVMFAWSNRGDL